MGTHSDAVHYSLFNFPLCQSLPNRQLARLPMPDALPGGFYDPEGLTEDEATAVIHRALDLGITLFNTSDLYGPFTGETVLGERASRDVCLSQRQGYTAWLLMLSLASG